MRGLENDTNTINEILKSIRPVHKKLKYDMNINIIYTTSVRHSSYYIHISLEQNVTVYNDEQLMKKNS